MGVSSYDVSNGPVVSAVSEVLADYNNPTFSAEDKDQTEQTIGHMGASHVIQVKQTAPRVVERTTGMPSKRGDNIKLAFLIGFPLVFMIIGIIFTGTYV